MATPQYTFTFPLVQPRGYQLPSWKAFHSGIKNLVISWPRRHGKDLISTSMAVDYALTHPNSAIVLMAPTLQWGRRIWLYKGQEFTVTDPITGYERKMTGSVLDVCLPEVLRKSTNKIDATITLYNGSTIQVMGSDSGSFIGMRINLLVVSETASHKPSVFSLLSPVLEESNGITIYNGTVTHEENHYWKMIQNATTMPNSFHVSYLTLQDTKTAYWVSEEDEEGIREFNINPELEGKISPFTGRRYTNIEQRRTFGESKNYIMREYCNIPTSVEEGSYYHESITALQREGRISDVVSVNFDKPVHAAIDLGVSDHTSIVWYQVEGDQITFVDCYENNGKDIGHYIDILRSKPYTMGCVFAPHDAGKRSIVNGLNLIDYTRKEYGFVFSFIPRTLSVMEDIQVCRSYLAKACFNRSGTKRLVSALLAYRENAAQRKPYHGPESHMADACRYAITSVHKGLIRPNALMYTEAKPVVSLARDVDDHQAVGNRRIVKGLARDVDTVQDLGGMTYIE